VSRGKRNLLPFIKPAWSVQPLDLICTHFKSRDYYHYLTTFHNDIITLQVCIFPCAVQFTLILHRKQSFSSNYSSSPPPVALHLKHPSWDGECVLILPWLILCRRHFYGFLIAGRGAVWKPLCSKTSEDHLWGLPLSTFISVRFSIHVL